MKIRAVGASDTEAVVALWRLVFPEYEDPLRPQRDPRANIARKLEQADDLFWLAMRDGSVLGTVMAGYDGHRGWLYSLGVHPLHRRQGIGRVLLASAEAALARRGCPKINLQVFEASVAAQAFWRAAGYAQDPVLSFGRRLEAPARSSSAPASADEANGQCGY